MICILLPWPISVNRAYRNVPKVGRVKTEALRKWIEEAGRHLHLQQISSFETMLGRLKLTIHANPPDKRRRDYSNIIKVVEDLLKEWEVYKDDSQIKDVRCFEDTENASPGSIVVTVEKLDPS